MGRRNYSQTEIDAIIKYYYEGGVLCMYESNFSRTYRHIDQYISQGLFFRYYITDRDCDYDYLIMPTYQCEMLVKQWEQQRHLMQNIRVEPPKFVGYAQAYFTEQLSTKTNPPIQRLKTKPQQRR